MITIKSQDEIKKMIKSAKILAEVKQIVYDAIVPGISTKELDDIAYDEIIKRGAKPAFKGYLGFKGTACISVNEELIHGIPSDKKIINEGDIVKIDTGAIWKGYYSDSAFTKGVGKITDSDLKLIDVTKQAFFAGVNAIKPGARVGDIEYAIGEFLHSKGYFAPIGFSGHGIGKNLHEDPIVNNYGHKGTGAKLKDGMTICIEPMVLQGSRDVTILQDGWTVVSDNKMNTAHYEHTILIKDGYPILLTEGI